MSTKESVAADDSNEKTSQETVPVRRSVRLRSRTSSTETPSRPSTPIKTRKNSELATVEESTASEKEAEVSQNNDERVLSPIKTLRNRRLYTVKESTTEVLPNDTENISIDALSCNDQPVAEGESSPKVDTKDNIEIVLTPTKTLRSRQVYIKEELSTPGKERKVLPDDTDVSRPESSKFLPESDGASNGDPKTEGYIVKASPEKFVEKIQESEAVETVEECSGSDDQLECHKESKDDLANKESEPNIGNVEIKMKQAQSDKDESVLEVTPRSSSKENNSNSSAVIESVETIEKCSGSDDQLECHKENEDDLAKKDSDGKPNIGKVQIKMKQEESDKDESVLEVTPSSSSKENNSNRSDDQLECHKENEDDLANKESESNVGNMEIKMKQAEFDKDENVLEVTHSSSSKENNNISSSVNVLEETGSDIDDRELYGASTCGQTVDQTEEKEESGDEFETTGTTKEDMEEVDIIIEQDKNPKIHDDIDSKIEDLLANVTISDSESENVYESDNEPNEFINTMAEEGEEDTPSEGSNDIIEVGEEINTTESEFSTDESYDNNSFIDDEDDHALLSGEEFDLSLETNDKPKKSRIIKFSSESDGNNDVIIVEKPEKKTAKKKRKSRIIRFEDSSDDEPENELQSESDEIEVAVKSSDEIQTPVHQNEVTEQESPNNKKIIILENIRVQDIMNKDLSENINAIVNSVIPVAKNSNQVVINLTLNCSSENLVEVTQDSVICNAQSDANITENSSTDQAQGKNKKSKRRKRKKNPDSINLPSTAAPEIRSKKKRRRNRKTKCPASDETVSTSQSESNVQPPKKRKTNESSKPQLMLGNKCEVNSQDESDNERPVKKKKKNDNLKQEHVESETTKMNLVSEALFTDAGRKRPLLLDDWDVEYVSIKPSKKDKMVTKVKHIKEKKSKVAYSPEKFNSKDFRNSMLHDNKRIKRMDTKQLLKARIL